MVNKDLFNVGSENKMKSKCWLLFIIALSILIIALLLSKSSDNRYSPQENGSNTLDPIGTLIEPQDTQSKINVLVYPDRIYIGPFERGDDDRSYKSLTIVNGDYPKLFEQGIANQSFIRAELDNGKLKLSNNFPDHGGYFSNYAVLVNLESGVVEVEGK